MASTLISSLERVGLLGENGVKMLKCIGPTMDRSGGASCNASPSFDGAADSRSRLFGPLGRAQTIGAHSPRFALLLPLGAGRLRGWCLPNPARRSMVSAPERDCAAPQG